MKNVYFWGTGGGATEIWEILQGINQAGSGTSYHLIGLVGPKKAEFNELEQFSFVNTTKPNWKEKIDPQSTAIITSGIPIIRKKMMQEVKEVGLSVETVVHPTSIISSTCQVGKGCVIAPFVVLSNHVKIGDNCYINFHCSVGSYSQIGEDSVLSPGTHLGGDVRCGNNLFTGMNSTILPLVRIGSNVKVSAGALVARDIQEGSTVMAKANRIIQV